MLKHSPFFCEQKIDISNLDIAYLLTLMVDVLLSLLQGLDRPLILWLIKQRPKHGYELMAEIKLLTGRIPKPGKVYPLLSQLESEGYLVSKWVRGKGKRQMKRYSITAEGRVLLGKVSGVLNKRLKHVFEDLLNDHKENTSTTNHFGESPKKD